MNYYISDGTDGYKKGFLVVQEANSNYCRTPSFAELEFWNHIQFLENELQEEAKINSKSTNRELKLINQLNIAKDALTNIHKQLENFAFPEIKQYIDVVINKIESVK